jgi:hypothetical protein
MKKPNWYEGNEEIADLQWTTASPNDPKLCSACKTRAGKTPKEIEVLNDGYPIKTPCHDGCRCAWAPKVKKISEILPPELSKGIGEFKEMKYNPEVAKSFWANYQTTSNNKQKSPTKKKK